jgi:hypothetical protein
MSIRKNNRDLSTYVIGWEKYADNVNWNGGAAAEKASTCESRGIARPGGAIPGGRVGGGANASTSAGIATPGGAIPGAEVGGGANALRCAAWCHRRRLCAARGVAVAVVAPRVVLRVLSSGGRCGAWVSPPPFLRRVWYCGRGQCSACGVEVTVVAPRLVLRALSSGGRCDA